ncbi:MAG TPA: binary toxin-like calcium binding domain-containing protein, partial [Candidatus Binatia bacterium]|nr:binary toxin-like calcium binding domain-containing protein [Candidatus Binatia bacterium]
MTFLRAVLFAAFAMLAACSMAPSDDSPFDGDGDGLSDGIERSAGLDPHDPNDAALDPDGDLLSSRNELLRYHTDPHQRDTDNDGLMDGDEVLVQHTGPTLADTEDDGLDDGEEVLVYATDPLRADSDGDGIADGEEVHGFVLFDRVTRVSTDPLSVDTDRDGLHDGLEQQVQDRFATYASAKNAEELLRGALNPDDPVHTPALGG